MTKYSRVSTDDADVFDSDEPFSHSRQADQFVPLVDEDDVLFSRDGASKGQERWWTSVVLAWKYVVADVKRHRLPFAAAVITVALVVATVSMLLNTVNQSPLVFLRLYEDQLGEMDLVLFSRVGGVSGGPSVPTTAYIQSEPRASPVTAAVPVGNVTAANATQLLSRLPLLNGSVLSATLEGVEQVAGSVPRWVMLAEMVNLEHNQLVNRSAGNDSAGQDFDATDVQILVINTEREAAVGLGRQWDLPAPSTRGCYVSHGSLREVGILSDQAIGRTVGLRITLTDLLSLSSVSDAPESSGGDGGGSRGGTNDSAGTGSDSALSADASEIRAIVSRFLPSLYSLWDVPLLEASVRVLPNGTVVNGSSSVVNVTQLISALEDAFPRDTPFGDALRSALQSNLTGGVVLLPNGTLVVEATNLTVGDVLTLVGAPLLSAAQLQSRCTVEAEVGDPEGKWPVALGSVVVMSEAALGELFADAADAAVGVITNMSTVVTIVLMAGVYDALDPATAEAVTQALAAAVPLAAAITEAGHEAGSHPDQFAPMLVVQLRDRLPAYRSTEQGLNLRMVADTNAVALAVGLDLPATFAVPLADALQKTAILRSLLDNIFLTISCVVVALGALLVYALGFDDVESKTYEYGMLRALGLRARSLALVIGIRTLLAAVPGVALGLLMGWIASAPISARIADFAALPADLSMSPSALKVAVALGFLVPLLANIVPVRRATGKVLKDSLDLTHTVTTEVQVTVTRLLELGLEPWQTVAAVLLVGAGFLVYYLVPYAFVYKNTALFMFLLTLVLLGMLVGLTMLSQLLQPVMERGALWVLIPPGAPHAPVRPLVAKNLAGHRRRNSLAATMFALCQAFLVFSTTMSVLQSQIIADNVRLVLGADLVVRAPSTRPDLALDRPALSEFLEREMRLPDAVVVDYTFVSFELRNAFPPVGYVYLGTLPGYPRIRVRFYAVERNYLGAVYSDLYNPSGAYASDGLSGTYPTLPDGRPDVIAALFEYEEAAAARNGSAPGPTSGAPAPIPVPAPVASGVRDWIFGGLDRTDPDELLATAWPQQRRSLAHAYRETVEFLASDAVRADADLSPAEQMEAAVQVLQPPDGSPIGWVEWLAHPRAFIVKLPGFATFSSYRLAASHAPVLITEDTYARMVRESYARVGLEPPADREAQVPWVKLLVRLRPGTARDRREEVMDGLRPLLRSQSVKVTDTAFVVSTVDRVVELLVFFFSVCGAVGLLFGFLILWQSVSSNVREHGWELGVLRSLGLTRVAALLVYLYESLALVLVAVLLGTAIGVALAVSLTMQVNLFDELPYRFAFPTAVFVSLLSMSLLFTVVATYVPARELLRRPVASVLRHT